MHIPAPNYTQTPNDFFEIAKNLKEGELRVMLVIMRQTFGWRKQWDRISLSQLSVKTGMEKKSVVRSLTTLEKKGFIKKHKEGKNGFQKVFYTMVVEEPETEQQDGVNEATPGSNNLDQCPKDTRCSVSNNFTQCHKDTPPSVFRTPTKETLTKEKKENINIGRNKLATKNPISADAKSLGIFFLEEIKKLHPNLKSPNLEKWSYEFDLLIRKDKRSIDEIKDAILGFQENAWYAANILSPKSLRNHFDRIMSNIKLVKERDLIRKNRDFVFSLKNKFPLETRGLSFDDKYVKNNSTGKEVPFNLPHETFQEAIVTLFGGRYVR